MNYYVGNPLQTRGAEQYILQNGKGDGMHFLYVRNGLGLEVWISLDRCGDISRVSYKGDNMGYFSPCGYVAPQYYEIKGTGFMKSFTAGFFTTCGLSAVGAPCTDEGEEVPMHGTVSNIPAQLCCIEESDTALTVKLAVRDAVMFDTKLLLERVYTFSYTENTFDVSDKITNISDRPSPFMIMYHCNMGYPLLSENSVVKIPNNSFVARDEQAQKYIDTALKMEKPQALYDECCYYYDTAEKNGMVNVGIYNTDIQKGVVINYKKDELPCFTQWKMMGKTDYVLGLEPGNCNPDGRDIVRKNGRLEYLESEQNAHCGLRFSFVDNGEKFDNQF